jgi:hypothetical protein
MRPEPDDLCTLEFWQDRAYGDSHCISINFKTREDARTVHTWLEEREDGYYDFTINEYVQPPFYTAKSYIKWADK